MNLVGHVAVAVDCAPDAAPAFVLGAMLPDLASMARVRLAPANSEQANGELARGVAFHHRSDDVFHRSRWFNDRNCELRDRLLRAGVDRGAARACAHAGVEMLLDGAWSRDRRVERSVRCAFRALAEPTAIREEVHALVRDERRAQWSTRLDEISRHLDVHAYGDAHAIAQRLHRMTRGRSRIELRHVHVDLVAVELAALRPAVLADAGDVRAAVSRSTAAVHPAPGTP